MRTLACAALVLLLVATRALALDFAGTSSGVFINPTGPATMVPIGEGTSTFGWGTGMPDPPSSLRFTGTPFSGNFGSEFRIGSISYYNGTIVSTSGVDAVDLNTSLAFTTPTGVTQNFLFNFNLINTVNTGDPVESADYVLVMNSFDPFSIFSYNGNDYFLQFTRFEALDSFGSTPDANQFHVLESATGSANLFARLTTNPGPIVPEPGTLTLLGLGMAGLALYGKRRHAKA